MNRNRRGRLGVAVVAALCAVAVTGCSGQGGKVSASGYTEEQVKQRDIVNYHAFTGTIAPVTEKNVLPDLTGVKVLTVNVEKGDEVKEGDVLFTLDRDSLEENIKELEATINATEASNAASINSAQSTLNNYQKNLDEGLDSSINTAKNSMDSAYASLVSAEEKYNNEVALNNQQLSSTVLQAQQNVDSALNSLKSAQLSYSQAVKNRDDAKDRGQDTSVATTGTTSLDQAVATAELTMKNAQTTYDNALTSYEAAKTNEENTLTSYYDALIQAQQAYVNAVDSYNTAVRASETQLQTYQNNVTTAQASAGAVESNRLKLQNYKDQLEDCEVKAPMDGVVTALNVKEGDIASTAQAAAVITSFDTMKIDVKIDEYDILGVEEGSPVTVNIDALDKDYNGKIKTISRVATVSNGVSYFESEVDFDGDDDARSGMSAEVRLITSEAQDAVSVSSDAIQTAADGSAFVYVYEDENHKYLKEQPVTLGVSDGTYTEITAGLYLGDTILYIPSASDTLEMMMAEPEE